ncbi:MAG: hypothetical protein IH593_10725 [Bacteroidales bacterium]|nr:hypothetical protein [Bacteroidales bacterium]
MKKWMIGSLVLIAMMVAAAGVYAQTTDKEKKNAKSECVFVDKDKDGKCDTCGTTADACKKACTTTTTTATAAKDCSKCPSAAACGETKSEVVPAKEGTAPAKACCPGNK